MTVFRPLIYLFGFGGGDDVGLLATGCCDLSINTLELERCGAGLGGLGAGAFAISYLFGLGGGGVPGAAARGCCDPCTPTSPR